MVKKSECRERAKLLLAHYIEGATGELCDRKEVGSIVDLIADAVHEELSERLDRLEKAVGELAAANWQAQPCTPIKPMGDNLPVEMAEFAELFKSEAAKELSGLLKEKLEKMLPVWGGNFDGKHRCIVAAKTQKAAAEAFGVSVRSVRMYASVTGNLKEIEEANKCPGVPLRKVDNYQDGKWVKYAVS